MEVWTQTYDRLQAVLFDLVAVRSAQVGHQDDRGGACNIFAKAVDTTIYG